jgi:GMP synthase-like glutamine amidotransferase
VGGTAASAYDDEKFPWIPAVLDFLRKVGKDWPKVKMIGIWFVSFCFIIETQKGHLTFGALMFGVGSFGLQLLVRAYGGEVVKSPNGWEVRLGSLFPSRLINY